MSTRKNYSPEIKAQIVQELISGVKSIGQLASEYGVHPEAIRKWKYTAVKAMPKTLDAKKGPEVELKRLAAQHKREKEQLYAEIGKLTTQINWLKKKFPGLSERKE
jgi:transposase-like protein